MVEIGVNLFMILDHSSTGKSAFYDRYLFLQFDAPSIHYSRRKSFKVFGELQTSTADETRQLAVLQPFTVEHLLKSDERPLFARHLRQVVEHKVLSRNTSTKIPRDGTSTSFCELSKMVKPHRVVARVVKCRENEEAVFEWLHYDAAM